MDSGKVMLIGGAAAFAWWQGWLAPLGIPGPSSTPAAAPPPTGGSIPTPPAGTLTATPQQPSPPKLNCTAPLVASADGTACVPPLSSLVTLIASRTQFGDGPDQYNAYITEAYPSLGPFPDPLSIFPGWTRPSPMPFATYWAVTSGWLAKNKGLSGLRGYAGLGALAMQHGWGY